MNGYRRLAAGVLLWCWSAASAHAALTVRSRVERDVRARRAQALEAAGASAEALEEWQELLRLAPHDAQAAAHILRLEKAQQRAAAVEQALDRLEAGAQPAPGPEAPGARAPPAATEEPSAQRVARPSPSRVGTIGLVVDGQEVSLKHPIQAEEGRVLMPLRDVAAALYVSLIEHRPGHFTLVFPNGSTRMATVATRDDQEPVVTEEDVRELFTVRSRFDEARGLVVLEREAPADFETYVIEKSPEALREEAHAKAVERRAAEAPEPSGEIPEAARPRVDLRTTVSYGYRDPHRRPPERTLVYGLTGQAFEYQVRGESTRRDLGGVFDHDYTYLNFSNPELFVGLFDQTTNLSPLRSQSESLSGVKVRRAWDQHYATSFLWGEVDSTVSGTAGQVKYLGQLYQAGQEWRPASWWRMNNAVLFLEHEADRPSQVGTSTFPRRNLVSFSDVSLTLPSHLTVSGQAARAAYAPDDTPEQTKSDWDWRLATSWDQPRYRLGFDYEFVGDQYASVGNPANYRDFEGWNLFGSSRLTDDWSFSGSLLRFGNNVDEDPARTTLENQAFSLSTGVRLPREHTLNLAFSDFLANPSGPNPGSSNRTRLSRIDYGLPAPFKSRLLLNYFHSGSEQPAASDSSTDSVGGSLFKGFERGSSLFFGHQVQRSAFEEDPTAWDATTSLNANLQLRPTLSLYTNSAYSRSLTEETSGLDTASGSAGVRWQLSPDRALTAEYSVSSYDLDREHGRPPREWSVFVLLSQSFGFRTRPTFGSIEGRLVKDVNADGRAEPTEPGVEDVAVSLEGGREVRTDAQGRFWFTRVVPGTPIVTLDAASLPDDWTAASARQGVRVRRSQRSRVTVLLIQTATLQGRVFIDGNGDRTFQQTEEPLEDVAVVLLPGEQFRRTDGDGLFSFDHLIPGPYTVRLYGEDLPLGYRLASDQEVVLALTAGQTRSDVTFAVELLAEPSDDQIPNKHQ